MQNKAVDEQPVDTARRYVGAALVGAIGVSLLEGCASVVEAPTISNSVEFLATDADTYAALRNIQAPPSDKVAVVRGRSAATDGGEGVFVWNDSIGGSDDDATVIKPNYNTSGGTYTGSGRWVRIRSNCVHPGWFGAVGDGSTDDTSALQDAIDFVPTGWSIDLAGKTYRVTATLTIATPGIWLRNGKLILDASSDTTAVLVALNVTSTHIERITITTTEPEGVSHTGLKMSRVLHGSLTLVAVQGFTTGLHLVGVYTTRFVNCSFSNNDTNVLTDTFITGGGFHDACHVLTFENCSFESSGGAYGFRIPPDAAGSLTAVNTVLSRCLFQSSYATAAFSQTGGTYTTINNCYFEPGSTKAIEITSGQTNRILHNQVNAGSITIGSNVLDTLMVGNEIPGSVTFTDSGTRTERYSNRTVPNQFLIPNQLWTIKKLPQKLSGTTFTEAPHSPVDNTRIVHGDDYGPFGREHIFRKATTSGIGSFVEILKILVPEGYVGGSVRVQFQANSDKARGYAAGSVDVAVGSYGGTVAAAAATPTVVSCSPGGETIAVEFDTVVASSGTPRTVWLRAKVTSTPSNYGAAHSYVRGLAYSVSAKFNDSDFASVGEVGLRSM